MKRPASAETRETRAVRRGKRAIASTKKMIGSRTISATGAMRINAEDDVDPGAVGELRPTWQANQEEKITNRDIPFLERVIRPPLRWYSKAAHGSGALGEEKGRRRREHGQRRRRHGRRRREQDCRRRKRDSRHRKQGNEHRKRAACPAKIESSAGGSRAGARAGRALARIDMMEKEEQGERGGRTDDEDQDYEGKLEAGGGGGRWQEERRVKSHAWRSEGGADHGLVGKCGGCA
ncbi:hypothetical protein K438DRAFT_1755997 [Mycena galopus ATCC 62051]|nr:hypothetical protein K438DRAFT_1755997 [Mycena galopus ATCC 62051]